MSSNWAKQVVEGAIIRRTKQREVEDSDDKFMDELYQKLPYRWFYLEKMAETSNPEEAREYAIPREWAFYKYYYEKPQKNSFGRYIRNSSGRYIYSFSEDKKINEDIQYYQKYIPQYKKRGENDLVFEETKKLEGAKWLLEQKKEMKKLNILIDKYDQFRNLFKDITFNKRSEERGKEGVERVFKQLWDSYQSELEKLPALEVIKKLIQSDTRIPNPDKYPAQAYFAILNNKLINNSETENLKTAFEMVYGGPFRSKFNNISKNREKAKQAEEAKAAQAKAEEARQAEQAKEREIAKAAIRELMEQEYKNMRNLSSSSFNTIPDPEEDPEAAYEYFIRKGYNKDVLTEAFETAYGEQEGGRLTKRKRNRRTKKVKKSSKHRLTKKH